MAIKYTQYNGKLLPELRQYHFSILFFNVRKMSRCPCDHLSIRPPQSVLDPGNTSSTISQLHDEPLYFWYISDGPVGVPSNCKKTLLLGFNIFTFSLLQLV